MERGHVSAVKGEERRRKQALLHGHGVAGLACRGHLDRDRAQRGIVGSQRVDLRGADIIDVRGQAIDGDRHALQEGGQRPVHNIAGLPQIGALGKVGCRRWRSMCPTRCRAGSFQHLPRR